MIVRLLLRNARCRREAGIKIGFDVAINDNDGTSFREPAHLGRIRSEPVLVDLSTIGALVFGSDN